MPYQTGNDQKPGDNHRSLLISDELRQSSGLLSPRIAGTPRTPRRMGSSSGIEFTSEQFETHLLWKQFDVDWNDVRLADIVHGADNRERLKQVNQPIQKRSVAIDIR
uniref:Uncharacterized protein n=1 Tax=Spongospora subterranea TaxID=70186 RepID=A0A0H5QMW1_9EUKA|eukprot:CRZ03308.1 hypothetical protein [Spongospora subterranea]